MSRRATVLKCPMNNIAKRVAQIRTNVFPAKSRALNIIPTFEANHCRVLL